MKMGDLALLVASAAAVFLVVKAKGGAGYVSTWKPWKEITTYDGYQYFNDGESGLVITPQGEYVLNGVVVWSPNRMF